MNRGGPPLPNARGDISSALFERIRPTAVTGGDRTSDNRISDSRQTPVLPDSQLVMTIEELCDAVVDPLSDDDFQLALYCLYELSYRGFADVDDSMEVDPTVFVCRSVLERRFLDALTSQVVLPQRVAATPGARLSEVVSAFGGPSLSGYMRSEGTSREMNELLIHRSAYQLKEADPHTWGLPRLDGRAKSAMVEIQMDEYGNGVPGHTHAELFANTLTSAGLSSEYGHYLELLPGCTLATNNLISTFGMRRMLLPALLGHLAVFEMTSAVPMARYAQALRRLGYSDKAARFYDVHVSADTEHERVARLDLVDPFVAQDPASEELLLWGAQALIVIEDQFARHVLTRWERGESSLRCGAVVGVGEGSFGVAGSSVGRAPISMAMG